MSIFLKVFVIVILLGIVYAATRFAEPVRNNVQAALKVLGANSVQKNVESPTLPKDLEKDIGEQVSDAKKEAAKLSIDDLLGSFARLKKITNDLNLVKDGIIEQVQGLLK